VHMYAASEGRPRVKMKKNNWPSMNIRRLLLGFPYRKNLMIDPASFAHCACGKQCLLGWRRQHAHVLRARASKDVVGLQVACCEDRELCSHDLRKSDAKIRPHVTSRSADGSLQISTNKPEWLESPVEWVGEMWSPLPRSGSGCSRWAGRSRWAVLCPRAWGGNALDRQSSFRKQKRYAQEPLHQCSRTRACSPSRTWKRGDGFAIQIAPAGGMLISRWDGRTEA
jgi:hypothetical protein